MARMIASIPGLSVGVVVKERSRQICAGHVLQLFPNCVGSIVASTSMADRVELVVADYGSTDWPLHEWLPEWACHLPCTIVPVQGNFSRGKGRNCAAARASHPTILFLDADMLITREVLTLAYEAVRAGKVFVPIYRDLALDGQIVGDRSDGYGVLGVSKPLFEQAGRWPEFYSWGGEDTILFENLQRLAPVVRHNVDGLFHQWHPQAPWKQRFDLHPADTDYFASSDERCKK